MNSIQNSTETIPGRPLPWTEILGRKWLFSLLIHSLTSLPQVKLNSSTVMDGNEPYDAQIYLDIGGKPLILIVEIKKSAYPRDARESAARLLEIAARQSQSVQTVPILATATLSSGAKKLLIEKEIGYFDAGGSLYLPAKDTYIFVEKPPLSEKTRGESNVFRGRTTRVVHALVRAPEAWYTASQLASQIDVAVSTVSRTFIELERLELMESRGKGPNKERHVTKPAALFDGWVRATQENVPPATRRYFVPGGLGHNELIQELNSRLSSAGVEFALTGEGAAQLHSPFLTSVNVTRIRVGSLDKAEAALGQLAKQVDEGSNLSMIEAPERDEFLFKQWINGIPVVSPMQTYIDLLPLPGRAKEAAQHLRAERLGYLK